MRLPFLYFIFGFCLSVTLVSTPTKAAELCGVTTAMGPGCEVGIHTADFLQPIAKQMTPVTCWAASFTNLLAYSGLHLSEQTIVAQTSGKIETANASILDPMLNRQWTDDTGRRFVVSARITDNLTGTRKDITNTDVYEALKNGTPIYFADFDHAMVVLQVVFVPSPAGGPPIAVAGVVADPNPAAPNFRQLNPQEIVGMYAAIVSVSVQ
jgi:hypothetical protein